MQAKWVNDWIEKYKSTIDDKFYKFPLEKKKVNRRQRFLFGQLSKAKWEESKRVYKAKKHSWASQLVSSCSCLGKGYDKVKYSKDKFTPVPNLRCRDDDPKHLLITTNKILRQRQWSECDDWKEKKNCAWMKKKKKKMWWTYLACRRECGRGGGGGGLCVIRRHLSVGQVGHVGVDRLGSWRVGGAEGDRFRLGFMLNRVLGSGGLEKSLLFSLEAINDRVTPENVHT